MQLRSTISRVRLSLESLEERLTPSWSSTPPATLTSLPASFTSITQNSAGDATGNASIATTEIDWYRFTATASGAATFQALTPASNLDTVIAVYNSSRARVGYNDDISNTNRDSRFTVNLTAGQTYYFGVTNYTGTAGGSYTWSLDGAAASGGGTDDSYENNDTRATASVLGSLTASRTINNLVMADGNDWYQFTLPTAGASDASVSISFLHSQGDLDLELYNAAGTRIGNSDSATNSEFISLSGLAAGTYTVRVLGYNGANNPNYSMVLTPGTGGTSTGNFDIQLRMTGLTASQQAIFQQAVARWQQIIIGDLPAATYNGVAVDDLLIDASASPIDGAGGILGQAGPDRFRSGSSLPYHGTMQFDSADLASLESSGGLIYTVIHEIGHILGIGTIWTNKGLLSGAGTSNPLFTGAQATAAYNSIFGTNASGVPVENSGGSGTRDSHWRETTFGNELMTGYLNNGANPLSRITVGSLADLGYQVDMSRADSYSPPGGALRFGGSGSSSGSGTALRLADLDWQNLTKQHPEIIRSSSVKSLLINLASHTTTTTSKQQQQTTDSLFTSTTPAKTARTTNMTLTSKVSTFDALKTVNL
ncbi:MAG: pre-peptidase C-terminal domain-containing protein [Gemmatales bacterium]